MGVPQISDSELVLMRIVWEHGGSARYADLADALAAKGYDWKKNTVLTFLARLQDKGMLAASKIGRRNEYRARVTEADFAAEQTRSFLNRVYEGDAQGLVATLLERDMISPDDVQALRAFWEEAAADE